MTTIAIFGAASAIAQELARLYAADGAVCFLVGRSGERLDTIARDLKARGAAAVSTAVADLADTAAHRALVEQAHRTLGSIDQIGRAHV